MYTLGDVHIYSNHMEQIQTQIKREPRPLPYILIDEKVKDIDDFVYESFQLFDYDPHPHIAGKVAV